MVAMRAVMKPGARQSPLNPCLAPTIHERDEIFTVRAVSTSPSALPAPGTYASKRVHGGVTREDVRQKLGLRTPPYIQR